VLQRLVYSELMIQAQGRHSAYREMQDTWNAYWQAYRDYFVFSAGNEVPRDRGVGAGADYLDNHPVLWSYLINVVDPKFEQVHSCIVKAHDQFMPGTGAPDIGSDKTFKDCMKASARAYWAQPWENSAVVDPWGRFKDCAGTFVLQIEYDLRFRQELAAENPDPNPEKQQSLKDCPPAYQGNKLCRQMRFNDDMYEQMYDNCGDLPSSVLMDLGLVSKAGHKVQG
jgi:hypothetical protein